MNSHNVTYVGSEDASTDVNNVMHIVYVVRTAHVRTHTYIDIHVPL